MFRGAPRLRRRADAAALATKAGARNGDTDSHCDIGDHCDTESRNDRYHCKTVDHSDVDHSDVDALAALAASQVPSRES